MIPHQLHTGYSLCSLDAPLAPSTFQGEILDLPSVPECKQVNRGFLGPPNHTPVLTSLCSYLDFPASILSRVSFPHQPSSFVRSLGQVSLCFMFLPPRLCLPETWHSFSLCDLPLFNLLPVYWILDSRLRLLDFYVGLCWTGAFWFWPWLSRKLYELWLFAINSLNCTGSASEDRSRVLSDVILVNLHSPAVTVDAGISTIT